MAWCYDRDRVLAVRRPDRSNRRWPVELPRNLTVTAGLAERDREQRLPDALLEIGAFEVERHSECCQFARKVCGQLALRLDENGIARILLQGAKAYPLGVVVLPEDGCQTRVARDQLQLPDR